MNLVNEKILSGVILGFEMEFYSVKSRTEIAKELGLILKKKIKIGDMYHSETEIDANTFKIAIVVP